MRTVLAILCVVTAFGCKKDNDVPAKTEPAPVAAPAPGPTPTPAPAEPVPAKLEHITGPGFSFDLSAGWKSVPPDDNKLFVAAVDDERRVSVMHLPNSIPLEKQEDCEHFGAELRKRLAAKEGVSKLIDTQSGHACSHIMLAKDFVLIFTHFNAPKLPLQMLCVVRETDKTGALECSQMWKSFALEKT